MYNSIWWFYDITNVVYGRHKYSKIVFTLLLLMVRCKEYLLSMNLIIKMLTIKSIYWQCLFYICIISNLHRSSIWLPLNVAGVYFQTYLTSAFEAMTEALLLQHQVLERICFCRHHQVYKIPNMLLYRSPSNGNQLC